MLVKLHLHKYYAGLAVCCCGSREQALHKMLGRDRYYVACVGCASIGPFRENERLAVCAWEAKQ